MEIKHEVGNMCKRRPISKLGIIIIFVTSYLLCITGTIETIKSYKCQTRKLSKNVKN